MRRYAKPNTEIKTTDELTEEPVGYFDVSSELEKCQEILRREIRNLMTETARGKLSEKSSRDLVAYMKLLGELSDGQEKIIKETPTEALKKLLNKKE